MWQMKANRCSFYFFFLSFFYFFFLFVFNFPFDGKTHKLIWLVGSVINPLGTGTGCHWCHSLGFSYWDRSKCSLVEDINSFLLNRSFLAMWGVGLALCGSSVNLGGRQQDGCNPNFLFFMDPPLGIPWPFICLIYTILSEDRLKGGYYQPIKRFPPEEGGK